eukprot:scaffold1928_cov381-Prasinococcus_capsulatus_cf.AAC.30
MQSSQTIPTSANTSRMTIGRSGSSSREVLAQLKLGRPHCHWSRTDELSPRQHLVEGPSARLRALP